MFFIICAFTIIILLSLFAIPIDFKLKKILKEEGIQVGFWPFYFSHRKFREFVECYHEDDNRKKEYFILYKKAVWARRIMYFLVLLWFISILIGSLCR